MTYKKGDERGYFTKVVAGLAVLALLGSILAYTFGANNGAFEKEVRVGNENGAVTVVPSDNGTFPTENPPVPIQ